MGGVGARQFASRRQWWQRQACRATVIQLRCSEEATRLVGVGVFAGSYASGYAV